MAKLIYSMLTSLDGYTEDEHGRFGSGVLFLRYGVRGGARGRDRCRVGASSFDERVSTYIR
jgi:hypothetical protein